MANHTLPTMSVEAVECRGPRGRWGSCKAVPCSSYWNPGHCLYVYVIHISSGYLPPASLV